MIFRGMKGAFKLSSFKRKKPKPNGNGKKKTSKGKGIIMMKKSSSSSFGIGRCTSTGSICSSDWLVIEILSRLPVKSLCRFKTVSKRWCSFIQKNQVLIDIHLTRSKQERPRLFMVVPVPLTEEQQETRKRYEGTLIIDSWPYKEFHITAQLIFEEHKDKDKDKEEEEYNGGGCPHSNSTKLKLLVDTVREIDSSSYDVISKPLNGLICLIEKTREYATRVYNIATREMSPWFQSSLRVGQPYLNNCIPCFKLDHNVFASNHAIGFDPATNEHKLVCVWQMMFNVTGIYFICEVLTIGGQGNNNYRWRRITEVPPCILNEDFVYVNGVIYWTNTSLCRSASKHDYRPVYLVAFDVGSEKFRTVTIPDFIPCHPGVVFGDEIVKLFEVDGSLAMAVRLNNCTFKMYIYEEDDYKEEEEEINDTFNSSSCRKNGKWSEVRNISLPFYMEECQRVTFDTFIGSQDKVFVTSSVWGPLGSKKE